MELHFDSDFDDSNHVGNATVSRTRDGSNFDPSTLFLYTSPKTHDRSSLGGGNLFSANNITTTSNSDSNSNSNTGISQHSPLNVKREIQRNSPSIKESQQQITVPSSDELLVKLSNSRKVFEKSISALKSSSPVIDYHNFEIIILDLHGKSWNA